MTSNRYVPIQPDRAGAWKKIKTASHLHDLLVDLQTDATGRVNYGRPFGYAWILSHWPGNPDHRPSVCTLKRHMATLKRAGLVEVRVVGFGGGMMVRLLGSAKWKNELPPPAEQLSLLSPVRPIRTAEKPVEKAVEKPLNPVENLWKSCGKPVEKLWISTVSKFHMGSSLIPNGDQVRSRKELKNKSKETITALSRDQSMPPAVENTDTEARRRLLLEQAEAIKAKYKTAG